MEAANDTCTLSKCRDLNVWYPLQKDLGLNVKNPLFSQNSPTTVIEPEKFLPKADPKLELYFQSTPYIAARDPNKYEKNQSILSLNSNKLFKEYKDIEKVTKLDLVKFQNSFPFQFGSFEASASDQKFESHDFCPKIKSKYTSSRHIPDVMQNKDYQKARLAINVNNTDLLRRILNKGKISPNQADNFGRTLLHMATKKKYLDVSRVLLEYGADLNLKDKMGYTPLHLAALSSSDKLMHFLIKSGTNIKSVDVFDNNPLDIALTKLRIVQNCFNNNFDYLKVETINAVEMLKKYFDESKVKEKEVEILSEICSRLSLSNSANQIQDDIKHLLSNLESINLNK